MAQAGDSQARGEASAAVAARRLALRWIRVVAVAVSLVDLAVFVLDDVLSLSRLGHLAAFGLGFGLGG